MNVKKNCITAMHSHRSASILVEVSSVKINRKLLPSHCVQWDSNLTENLRRVLVGNEE